MPRKPRIEIPGYYHVINRGVEQRVVFTEKSDYEYFEELMCFYAKSYGITIHNYCLMSNHYHLLVEIERENLSKFMRQLNMNYAIYFNKKEKRTGHLWQGRFKSWYVTDEAYLYTLMLYIEQNPMKAGLVKTLNAYPYCSAHYFLHNKHLPECLQHSWIAQHYKNDRKAISAFLNSSVNAEELQKMKKASSLVEAPNIDKKPDLAKLKIQLSRAEDTKARNLLIVQAYEEGYSQHKIAEVLGLSQPTVNGIIRRMKRNSTITIT